MESLTIYSEYITLGQLLKEHGLISTGGQAKFFLQENEEKIFVNTEAETRRGRKLFPGDFIDFPDFNVSVVLRAASSEEIEKVEKFKEIERKVTTAREKEKRRIKAKDNSSK